MPTIFDWREEADSEKRAEALRQEDERRRDKERVDTEGYLGWLFDCCHGDSEEEEPLW